MSFSRPVSEVNNDEAIERFIYLLLTSEECIMKWVTSGVPPISDLPTHSFSAGFTTEADGTKTTPPTYRILLECVRDQWNDSHALLTRTALDHRLQRLHADKIESMAVHVARASIASSSPTTTKPGDYEALTSALSRYADHERLLRGLESLAKYQKDGDLIELTTAKKMIASINSIPKTLKIKNSNAADGKDIVEPAILLDGLLRQGEIANVVSGPKLRKSWAMTDLAFSVANGLKWLGQFQCEKAPVLLIDNELREWQLRKRFGELRKAKGLQEYCEFDFCSLRDDGSMDIFQLCEMLEGSAGKYGLIILDALYRFFPAKFDENSNSDMTRLYNTLDTLSRTTGAAIVVVHHTSKGNQAGKATTDAGSGAGAQSRAADAHIVLRANVVVGKAQEEAPNEAQLTAVVRGFAPVSPLNLKWNFPCWEVDTSKPKEEEQVEMSSKEYAHRFASPDWESRESIEGRAKKEGGLSVREARGYFTEALSEGELHYKEEKMGRNILKRYCLKTSPTSKAPSMSGFQDLTI